jgi:hypothetical protein
MVLRISADEEQGFVKANERSGVIKFAPADFAEQRPDALAVGAKAALRFIEFVKQLVE